MTGVQRRLVTIAAGTVASALLGVALLTGCMADPAADGQQNTTPGATQTVPAPSGGTIDEVVPDATVAPTVEASTSDPAALPDGVVVSVSGTQKVEVVPQTPGEVAGPALAVTITVRNDTSDPIATSAPIVSLTARSGAYGQPTTASPSTPFPESVAAGQEATGTFVFMLPADDRDAFTVSVQYLAGAPVAVFTT